jgi:mediator of RNA polymerase II transcription subunit 12
LDYFPWTGTHNEDSFNDNVIRQGYFDKVQTGQNETASAKQQLYPSLRQKNALQTLGSLFAHVLGQRRQHSQITAAPSFKPPPRVTLTDTKRETWLRDLANPLIPLRRLSRTIPHGIKNKVLLEQCTRKNVPTERAVWLAKCVGANEIRASKRKGVPGALAMGGESKWIRDWTVCVEQFVDGVVAAGGDKDWKSKVLYS